MPDYLGCMRPVPPTPKHAKRGQRCTPRVEGVRLCSSAKERAKDRRSAVLPPSLPLCRGGMRDWVNDPFTRS